MKRWILLLMLGWSCWLPAQEKRSLTHRDYDYWRSIQSATISSNGAFVAYVLQPEDGDPTLILYHTGMGMNDTFQNGYNPGFTYDGRFLVYKVKPTKRAFRQVKKDKLPDEKKLADSLAIVNLANGQRLAFGGLSKLAVPEHEGNWIAFTTRYMPAVSDSVPDSAGRDEPLALPAAKKKTKKPEILHILNLETQREWTFGHAGEMTFSKNGYALAFTTVTTDSTGQNGFFVFSTSREKLVYSDTGHVHYKLPAVDPEGGQAAFLASDDSLKAKNPVYALYYWKSGQRQAILAADTLTAGMPSGWAPSPNGTLWFSEEGTRLYLGTAPIPESEPKDTLLEEEKVHVTIWSWKDPKLQPQQEKELKAEKTRTYLAYYEPRKKLFRQLADERVPVVRTGQKGEARFAVGIDEKPYLVQRSWESPYYYDIYSVDLLTGGAEPLATKLAANPRLSPEGKYFYWYDPNLQNWYVQSTNSGKRVNVSEKIPFPVYDEEVDIPRVPWAYGAAGWTEDDKWLLLYDRYDIWRVDPQGHQAPVCLTLGLGRENKLVFRYIDLDKENEFIRTDESAIFSAFDKRSKASGFFRYDWREDAPPELLLIGDYYYSGLQKARTADKFIFTRESYNEFPDLWFSDFDFPGAKRISRANPWQDNFYWGQVRLISWVNHAGDTLQGLLYIPEPAEDSARPLLVYFYERYSDRLNRYILPEPRRSTIDPVFYVSNGYVVFIPDIRYRIGHPGQSALDCVLTGVDAVLKTGLVDSTRMGLQGQSWGGYQVAYIITQTNRFAAAMAGAPVSNMTSAYGGIRWGSGMSRMFQYETTQSRIGASLWDAFDLYYENSPVFFAPNVQTPLLMMHNDHDGAVPWYQGIEYFVALRRLGKPVWMLSYNKEEHNLTRRPNKLDLTIRMNQFFDHYLKGKPMPDWMRDGVPAVKKDRVTGIQLLKPEK